MWVRQVEKQEAYEKWVKSLDEVRMPRWEEITEIPLYMDQLIAVVTKYLEPFQVFSDDKIPVTSSMVNNYVKLNLIPKPIKRHYNKRHIAYLIVITLFKEVISIQDIRRVLIFLANSQGNSNAYNQFCELLEKTIKHSGNVYLNKTDDYENNLNYASKEDYDRYIIFLACEMITNLLFAKKFIDLIEQENEEKSDNE
jgi:DNA-binding transcriptional MerR regulator